MNYPLISEYIDAIKSAEENFQKLSNLRPVLDDYLEPVMTSGNFAVVFKMEDEQTGKLYAVKCFLKEQEGRAEAYRLIAEELENVNSIYLTPIKYLDKELFVDTSSSDESEFPVLLMDWVEGQTLDKYIREHIYDQYELSLLAYQFSSLAMWLMTQPFAHGDLKPDNILVKEDGALVLVDYDGMYVPAMKGQKARELGSPDFRHPSRTEDDFDEHIDDFSLVSILLSLKAISLQSELLEQYGSSDRLLFSANDYRNLSKSQVVDSIKTMMQDAELATLYSLFILSSFQNNLRQVSCGLLRLSRPQAPKIDNLSTEVTQEDLANAWVDEYGVKYSADRRRLLRIPNEITEYRIRRGTYVICDLAFGDQKISGKIDNSLQSIYLPDSIMKISNETLCGSQHLIKIVVDEKNTVFDSRNNCNAVVITQCNELLLGCQTTIIPNDVTKISNNAFLSCSELESIVIPNSVTTIGDQAFMNCSNLKEINIPVSVNDIGDRAFNGCDIERVVVDKGNSIYDSRDNCNAIILTIENRLVYGCKSSIIPLSVTDIGVRSFECCDLKTIEIPNNVKSVGNSAFMGCYNLQSVIFPSGLINISDYAFSCCCNLASITFSNSLIKIGYDVFGGCDKIESIYIPKGSREYFEKVLDSRLSKLLVEQEKVDNELLWNLDEENYLYKQIQDCASRLFLSLRNEQKKDLDEKLMHVELTILSAASVLDVQNEKNDKWREYLEQMLLNEYLSIKEVDDYDELIECNTPGMSTYDIYTVDNAISLIEFEKENGQIKFYRGNINAYPYDVTFWGEFNDKNGGKSIIYVDQGFPSEYKMSDVLKNKSEFGIVEEKDRYNHSNNTVYCLKSIKKKHSMLSSYINQRLSSYEYFINDAVLKEVINSAQHSILLYNTVVNGMLNFHEPSAEPQELMIDDDTIVNCNTGTSSPYNATCMNDFSKCIWENLRNLRQVFNKITCNGVGVQDKQSIESISIRTDVTDDDLSNAWIDECGVKYSADRKRLLIVPANRNLKNYKIKEGTIVICNQAFIYCDELENVTIPPSLKMIGDIAFFGCHKLNHVIIPKSVNHIGVNPFVGCIQLNDIICESSEYVLINGAIYTREMDCIISCILNNETFNLPNSIIRIGDRAFMGNHNLTNIEIPYSVKEIGDYSFCACRNLKEITIPNSVKEIGTSSFKDCVSLEEFIIPESVKKIGDSAFYNCKALKRVFLNNFVKDVGKSVFTECDNLSRIIVPSGKKEMFEHPYFGGIVLVEEQDVEKYSEEVTDEDLATAWIDEFGAKYSSDKKRLLKGPEVASYIINNGTLVICESAFSMNEYLTDVYMPDSVVQIGKNAFWSCKKLNNVTLSKSVKVIKTCTFEYCFSLRNIDIPESVKKIESGAFVGCPCKNNLIIPKDTVVESGFGI